MQIRNETPILRTKDIHLLFGSQAQHLPKFLSKLPISDKTAILLQNKLYPTSVIQDFTTFLLLEDLIEQPVHEMIRASLDLMSPTQLLIPDHPIRIMPDSSGKEEFRTFLMNNYISQGCLEDSVESRTMQAILNCQYLRIAREPFPISDLENHYLSEFHPGFVLELDEEPRPVSPIIPGRRMDWFYIPALTRVLPFLYRRTLTRNPALFSFKKEVLFLENYRSEEFLSRLEHIRNHHKEVRDHLCQLLFNYRGSSWLPRVYRKVGSGRIPYLDFLHFNRIDAPQYNIPVWNIFLDDDTVFQNILFLLGVEFTDEAGDKACLEEHTLSGFEELYLRFPPSIFKYVDHLLGREESKNWALVNHHTVLSALTFSGE